MLNDEPASIEQGLNRGPSVVWSMGIVPVQAWIGEARRSRDLLAGSTILSWLMARLLSSPPMAAADVRLPPLDGGVPSGADGPLAAALDGATDGIPSRASGLLEATVPEAARVFEEVERTLVASWELLRKEVAAHASRSAADVWKLVGAFASVAPCPFQLVWCVEDAAEGDLASIDRLFVATKRSRRVLPHEGAPVPKCSQCGRREAAGGRDLAAWKAFQEKLQQLEGVRSGRRIDEHERLCAVCLVKRFAGYLRSDQFPSTSAIAARDWLWAVRSNDDLRSLLEALEAAAGRLPGESGDELAPHYYRRTIDRELERARRRADPSRRAAVEEVRNGQRALSAGIERWNASHPTERVPGQPAEYLAVVVFDGDDIGRHLHERLDEVGQGIRSFQAGLRDRLAGSREGPLGRAEAFYLGGDEGLLLAPASTVLDLAHGLREQWREAMEPLGENGPTLSVGVTVFDRERPLGPAIEMARTALARAKAREGWHPGDRKNGLAVTIQTASGSGWTAVAGWGEGWDRARSAVGLLRSGLLSSGWPHDVEGFVRSLDEEAWSAGEAARGAVRQEVKRLTFRRVTRRGVGAGTPVDLEDRCEQVWERLGGHRWWGEQPSLLERATQADQLHVVAFLARQAGGRQDAA
jgi:CRISPR-associated protein Cmr2